MSRIFLFSLSNASTVGSAYSVYLSNEPAWTECARGQDLFHWKLQCIADVPQAVQFRNFIYPRREFALRIRQDYTIITNEEGGNEGRKAAWKVSEFIYYCPANVARRAYELSTMKS